jgi:hypothetical protein
MDVTMSQMYYNSDRENKLIKDFCTKISWKTKKLGEHYSNGSSDMSYVHFPRYVTCWKTELKLVVLKLWALSYVNYIMNRENRHNCVFATRIKCRT